MPFSAIPTISDEVVALLLIGDQEPIDELEAIVLRAFPDALVDRASTASEARSWMARGSYHMMMSADRLSDEDGVSLLREAHKNDPSAVRVLLGGELSSELAAEAINSGKVYRILTPPYTHNLVERCIRNGLDWRQHGLAMSLLLKEQREVHLALAASLSALERTQRQMVHVERLATVGRLTSGIIHEVRNQLTGLMGVLDTIRYGYGRVIMFNVSSFTLFLLISLKDSCYQFFHFGMKYIDGVFVLTVKLTHQSEKASLPWLYQRVSKVDTQY